MGAVHGRNASVVEAGTGAAHGTRGSFGSIRLGVLRLLGSCHPRSVLPISIAVQEQASGPKHDHESAVASTPIRAPG